MSDQYSIAEIRHNLAALVPRLEKQPHGVDLTDLDIGMETGRSASAGQMIWPGQKYAGRIAASIQAMSEDQTQSQFFRPTQAMEFKGRLQSLWLLSLSFTVILSSS